jgi:hypothetical protein
MKFVNANCRMMSASLLFYGMRRDETIINLMQFEGRKILFMTVAAGLLFAFIKIQKASD